MPFGESFISTPKSNKTIMLDKSRRFRKTPGGFDWSKSQQFIFKKATPGQLKEISERLQKENKQTRIKQLAVLIAIMGIIISFFVLKLDIMGGEGSMLHAIKSLKKQ